MIDTTNKLMQQVLLALVPGVIVLFYFFGWGVVWQIMLACVAALASEALILAIRRRPILPNISDGSALITAVLLAISIPSIAPWWLVVLGTIFAIVFGKQIYGGLGHNPFNPAMLGYVFLLIAYPLEMTRHQMYLFLEFIPSIDVIFTGSLPDAITSATILDRSFIGASISTQHIVIGISFLLGGIYLLFREIIFWQIPTMMLLAVLVFGHFLHLIDYEAYQSGYFHLFAGATMLGAFFIATDPISASTTPRGRLIYGFGVGVLVIIIRELSGNYPDGVAFAVLLMNIFAPLIDAYTKPKTLRQ